MKKGGYKIIDFKGTALSGTAVEMSGIYDQIVDDYDKPIMVSGVILSGELQDDAYASVKVSDDLVELTVYGGVITVTEDDEVSFALAKTVEETLNDLLITREYQYNFTFETGSVGTRAVSVAKPEGYDIEGYTPIDSAIKSLANSSSYWGYIELNSGELKVYRASSGGETEGRITMKVLYMKEGE